MRLSETEIAGIKDAVAEVFGPDAVVRLFGSRVDDTKKGGDIDLLIEVPEGRDTLANEARLAVALERRIGERKVDMLFVEPGRPLGAFERIALAEAVLL